VRLFLKIEHSNHAAWALEYHIVWCTKYRHPVLVGAIADECVRIVGETCREYDWRVVELNVQPDHVHLIVSVPPTVALTDVSRTIKSLSAVRLFSCFPALKKNKFWGTGLWSRGSYYGSVGQVSEKTVLKYVTNQ
jgi:putative transposase